MGPAQAAPRAAGRPQPGRRQPPRVGIPRWLLDNDLVDEITLLIVPVVLGQGTRLFPAADPDIALDLVESRADSKGVTIQVYRPAGRRRYAIG